MSTVAFVFAAFVAVVAIAPMLSVPLSPLVVFARKRPYFGPAATALVAGASTAAALFVFVIFVHSFHRAPTLVMFLVPYVLVLGNDLNRISRAWTGDTPIRASLEAAGELYDSRLQAHMEIGSLVGDTLGFWLLFLLIAS